MEDTLNQFVERLQKAYSQNLVSVILYGSRAAGDYQDSLSDYNILCVLERVNLDTLSHSGAVFRWWRDLGHPSPLLLGLEELKTSTDCFPVEFHDIKECHRILHGSDVVTEIEIDDKYYRAEVEYELRAKLLRLRQKAAGILPDRDLLCALMVDSLPTFCTLFRHAIRLSGGAAGFAKREVVVKVREFFELDTRALDTVLDLREEKKKPANVDVIQVFKEYLEEIEAVIKKVDQLRMEAN